MNDKSEQWAWSKEQIYHVSSEEDGYFVMILVSHSEDTARQLAWDEYTNVVRPGGEWSEYHSSSDEFIVLPLGRSFQGSDGEGNLEVV